MAWKMGKDCGNIPQKVEELPKYNKLRYQVPAIFADTTKNYGSRTNGKIVTTQHPYRKLLVNKA